MVALRRGAWLLLTIVLPHLAFAADEAKKAKAAAATAQQAAAAFERGDHKAAARAYLEAYKLDPATPDYLYGAARELQASGDDQAALDLFQQFAGLGGTDPKRVESARKAIAGLRSDDMAREAEVARRRGDAALAAQLFGDAWKSNPAKPTLLLRAARAAQEAGLHDPAVASLQQFLRVAPPNDPDRAEAQVRLDALTKPKSPTTAPLTTTSPVVTTPEVKLTPVVAPSVMVPTVVAKPAPPPKSRTAAWVTIAAGGAVLLTGGILAVTAMSDKSSLDSALAQTQHGLVSGVSFNDATARNDSIVHRNIAAGALAGAGVVVAGVGVWMLLGDDRVVLAPTGQGAALAGRW